MQIIIRQWLPHVRGTQKQDWEGGQWPRLQCMPSGYIGMMITVVHSYLKDTKIKVDTFEHDTKNTVNEVLNVSKI